MKKAFICVDSLRKKIDENPEFFTQRADYDLFICTIPVTRQDVLDFRALCPKAKLIGYTDPFYMPLAPGDTWRKSWMPALPEERWLKDGATGEKIRRWPYAGFYVHTFLTAKLFAMEHASLCAKIGLDGLYLDNFDRLLRYRFDLVSGVRRTLRYGKGVMPYGRLQIDYGMAVMQVLGSLRDAFGDDLLIGNSGEQFLDTRLNGRSQERYVVGGSFNGEGDDCYAIAYPDTWPRLLGMIADGTFPSGVGIMEDRLMAGPV